MTTNTTFDMTDLDDELDEANKKHNGHGAHGAGTDLLVSPPDNPMPNVRRFLANKYGHDEPARAGQPSRIRFSARISMDGSRGRYSSAPHPQI
jgi:hypothetical protein